MTIRVETGLRVLWSLALMAAFLVAMPLLFLAAILLAPAALSTIAHQPLISVLTVLWPVAGLAGVTGLILARQRRALGVRQLRMREVLLAAGIVGALAGIAVIAMISLDEAFAAILIAAFVVLIVDAIVRLHVLETRIAAISPPEERVAALLLGVAGLSALAAVVGHLAV